MTRSGRTARRMAGWTLVLVASSACAPLFGRGARGGGAGLAEKPVAQKEPPNAFLAADGTRCLVSEEKFRNTAPGERVWCFWTYDGTQRVADERSPARANDARPRVDSRGASGPPAIRKPTTTPRPSSAR